MKELDFIHNLASPVNGMEFILDSIMEDLTETGGQELATEKVKEIIVGLQKVKDMLKARREELTSGK